MSKHMIQTGNDGNRYMKKNKSQTNSRIVAGVRGSFLVGDGRRCVCVVNNLA